MTMCLYENRYSPLEGSNKSGLTLGLPLHALHTHRHGHALRPCACATRYTAPLFPP